MFFRRIRVNAFNYWSTKYSLHSSNGSTLPDILPMFIFGDFLDKFNLFWLNIYGIAPRIALLKCNRCV